jgi:hypothetical protein
MKVPSTAFRELRFRSLVTATHVALAGLLSVGAFAVLLYAASTTFSAGL